MKSSKFREEGQKRGKKLHAMGSWVSVTAVRLLQEQQPASSGRGPTVSALFAASVLIPIYCSLLGLFWGLVMTFEDS